MSLIRAALALLLLLAGATAVNACAVASGTVTLTDSSSYAVRSGGVGQSSGSAGFSCSGSIITLLGTDFAKATVSSANGFTLKGASGDAIPYTLSADSGGTKPITEGVTVNYTEASLLSLLGILGAETLSPKFYATPGSGANVAAGTYTDTLTVRWDWRICHGIGLGNLCVFQETGTNTASVTVSLTVGKDCRIVAPALTFAAAPLASQFAAVTQAVAVDCTKNAAYTIAFSNGGNRTPGSWRAMSDGFGNKLQYNIYRPDGTTIWDESNPLAGALPGTGALTPAQMQTYVAKVNPDPTTPPPVGHYEDMVSVIVAF